jgi:WD40 repeat protein
MYNVNIGSGGSYSLDFSPDNMKVAVDGDDGKIRIFDITNSNLLNTLNGHTAAITNIDWSNNGNFILSGGIDSTLIVWNATTGDQIHYFNLNQPIVSAKISHDNSKLIAALADSSIKIFDAVTFSELSSFTSTCPLLQVDLSYDNSFVAAGCDTSTLVFDAVTGTLISNFNIMNGGRVYSVAFQPNSYNLVTGTHNGDVVFWSMQGVLSTSAIQLNKTDYLFPNPATEYLYVDLKETLTTFSIVDFEGKTIMNGTTNGSINVTDLKEGLYHIFIKEDEKERIMKFIKKAN